MQRTIPRFDLRPLVVALSSSLVAMNVHAAMAATVSSVRLSDVASLITAATAGILRQVTSCADDGAPGTLRSAVGFAGTGDTIDLSGLPGANPNCSSSIITLSNGAVTIPSNKSLTFQGPTDATITIVGNGSDRVLYDANSFLQINDLTISGGKAFGNGGCIDSLGQVILQHSTVTNCYVGLSGKYASGGGVYGASVSLTQGSLVTGNKASIGAATGLKFGIGGGVAVKTQFSCTDSTISGNHADTAGGGAIARANGTVTLTNCTADNNSAAVGGALYAFGATGEGTVLNSTISGNTATKAAGLRVQATLTIINSTVAFNTASGAYAGGVYAGSVDAESSIIAKNTSTAPDRMDLQSSYLIGSKNLILSASTSNPIGSGVITITTNPKLAPLGNHGGLTLTHAPLATSPVLNQGSNSQNLPNDQRGAGFARVVNAAADIGAYERQINDDEIFYDGMEP